jgi:LacI family transcriptional regulator, galactose operon repressor
MRISSKPATIRDVAARAGVSTATVSRSLRGHANVSPETRAAVSQAASELHYRPSGVARSLKLRNTRTIGLIVTDIENPFYPQIVRAIEDAARAWGYSVLLADGRRDPDREIESLEVLAEREVDGMIIASTALTRRHTARIRELRCPVVIVNGESTVPSVPAVLSDNVMGGRLAAEHLLALGHRQLAFVVLPDVDPAAMEQRVNGVRAAIATFGADDIDLAVVGGETGVAGGDAAVRLALASSPSTSAFICANDLTAIGAIRGLRAVGRAVPHDVSVVGFDDIDIVPHLDPPLTTIHQSTTEMGTWAVANLGERIAARPGERGDAMATTPGPTMRLKVALVIRGSTMAPPRGASPTGRQR